MNRVILTGRLTRDPELRTTQNGRIVTKFTLAVDRGYKKETDFIDCVAWQKLAEIVADNLSKGRKVAVEGRLQIRSYETQEGAKRKAAEVVCDSVEFLDYKREPGEDDDTIGQLAGIEVDPDDLPF